MADESHDPRDWIASDPEETVDFSSFSRALEHYDYPATNEELLDEFGDCELAFPNGSETLAEVLSAHEGVTYESADEIRETVVNVAVSEPVGGGYRHRNEQS